MAVIPQIEVFVGSEIQRGIQALCQQCLVRNAYLYLVPLPMGRGRLRLRLLALPEMDDNNSAAFRLERNGGHYRQVD